MNSRPQQQLSALALGNVLIGNNGARLTISSNARDAKREPRPLGGRIAGVIVAKKRALTRNHLADSCGDRPAVHLLIAASIVAYRKIVGAHRDARARRRSEW